MLLNVGMKETYPNPCHPPPVSSCGQVQISTIAITWPRRCRRSRMSLRSRAVMGDVAGDRGGEGENRRGEE
jgi:hypothetical protein